MALIVATDDVGSWEQSGSLGSQAAGTLQGAHRDGTGRVGAREQEVLRTGAPPIGAKNAEQLLGQHDIAILPALAAADVNHHPGAVDILDRERHRFRHTQPGGVDPVSYTHLTL